MNHILSEQPGQNHNPSMYRRLIGSVLVVASLPSVLGGCSAQVEYQVNDAIAATAQEITSSTAVVIDRPVKSASAPHRSIYEISDVAGDATNPSRRISYSRTVGTKKYDIVGFANGDNGAFNPDNTFRLSVSESCFTPATGNYDDYCDTAQRYEIANGKANEVALPSDSIGLHTTVGWSVERWQGKDARQPLVGDTKAEQAQNMLDAARTIATIALK